jgi:hypothetical protein
VDKVDKVDKVDGSALKQLQGQAGTTTANGMGH